MLNEIDCLPEGLLRTPATELCRVLPGPTLLHLPGKQGNPLFISVLQHGNEFSGWETVRRLLGEYQNRELPRSLSIFIANIEAAGQGKRHLDHQPDYNRVWNLGDSREHQMMQAVLSSMERREVFASIDLHNNTGINPHYACINKVEPRFINLARLFSRTIVYFIRPDGVQSKAFSNLCPSVTLECGLPGEESGIRHSLSFIEEVFHLDCIADTPVERSELDLFHTVGIVKIREGISIGFNGDHADVILKEDIETMNLKQVQPYTVIAERIRREDLPIRVTDEFGNDITGKYFTLRADKLLTRQNIIPSMFTRNTDIILDDCLCYLMEHYLLE